MKRNILILLMGFLYPALSPAAQIAVVDSGTDFEHELLQGHEWKNPGEIPGNRVDDDRNGKVDDTLGWNFADGYNRVFFQEHTRSYDPVIYQLFEIIARQQSGAATEVDQKFWAQHVTSLKKDEKEALVAHLNAFGGYAHGTHVAGIIASVAPEAKIMAARIFADSLPPEYAHPRFMPQLFGWDWSGAFYKILAAVSNGTFNKIADYLAETKMDVANYSLGVSLQVIAKNLLALKGIESPTPEQLAAEVQKAAAKFEPIGRKWIAASPQTLFVIAAGNDGTSNDLIPAFPANIKMPNSISIAASQGYTKLASFSNFGEKTVDIAAPGVAILSSVPSVDHSARLPMSGTSMAAPFLAGVAARVKELNPTLSPAEIKQILMDTSDKKPWLKGFVACEGVVNPERAYAAATKSKSSDIKSAIADAHGEIHDKQETVTSAEGTAQDFSPNDLREAAAKLVF